MTDINRELVIKAKAGDIEARNELITRNIGLIRKSATYFKCKSMQYDDLIGEGTFGLIKAIDKFDLNKNIKFSTYAAWWIRATIARSIENKDLMIRVPANKIEKARFNRIKDADSNKIDSIYFIGSIDVPVSEYTHDENNKDSLVELLRGKFNTEECYERKELICLVRNTVNKLPEKEKYVICNYYGIGTQRKNIQEIAASLGKSFQRVHQIRHRAIQRIKDQYIHCFDGYAV